MSHVAARSRTALTRFLVTTAAADFTPDRSVRLSLSGPSQFIWPVSAYLARLRLSGFGRTFPHNPLAFGDWSSNTMSRRAVGAVGGSWADARQL